MTAKPTDPHIGLVVEGAGDRGALPVLLRMHLASAADFRDILGKPVPAHGREKAIAEGGLEGYVVTAGLRPGCVGVLVVLDGEGDCVAELGPNLLSRAAEVIGKPVRIALADVDFESWIYASAESLQLDLTYSEGVNGQGAIKGALKPQKYVKPTWQPRLASRIDLALARERSASLARVLDRFDELLSLLPQS
ncbi:hypothetical protein [Nocardioides aurantiacus]|uniref:hypothetical protein n=1 Tax=Nocardioides aurantiacus TaxID=86796 RepID=UPI0011CE5B35|nr:hypothetical protein [Nocardioides aurantiacus]